MFKVYRGFAYLIAGLVLVQAAMIAWGAFDLLGAEETVVNEGYEYNTGLETHAGIGHTLIPLAALLLLVLSFFTKVKNASKIAAVVFGLVVAQVVLGVTSYDLPLLGLLHGVNAFLILGGALAASRLGRTGAHASSSAPRETTAV